jgi:tRNA 2-thiouridine synthesizing protein A
MRLARSPARLTSTRKALAKLKPGDQLQVYCTDPLAAVDIPNMICETDRAPH